MRRTLNLFGGVLLVLILWWAGALILDVRVLPTPWLVFGRLGALLGADLLRHAGASLARVLVGLGVAVAAALPIGVLMGRVPAVDLLLRPIAYLLYPVPKIALLPVVLLVVGIGNGAKIVLLVLVLFFQVLTAVRDAARAVDHQYVTTLRSLGGTPRQVLRYVVWPVVLPRMLTALRVGSATALAVLFFAETFFTRYGLGYFIVDQWSKVAYVEMFAGIVALGILGVLLFVVIDALERRLCRWTADRPVGTRNLRG